MLVDYYDRMLLLGQEGCEYMDVVVDFFNANLDTLAPTYYESIMDAAQVEPLSAKKLQDVVTPDRIRKLSEIIEKMQNFFLALQRDYLKKEIDGLPVGSANFKDTLKDL